MVLRWTIKNTHFNSRPSARGDGSSVNDGWTIKLFQFTPLREGRLQPREREGIWQSISIHAPPRGATRAAGTKREHEQFQFTPLREGRRLTPFFLRNSTNFNSRPSARGDGFRYAGTLAKRPISIHAPPRGATCMAYGVSASAAFQFTPLREGRLKAIA